MGALSSVRLPDPVGRDRHDTADLRQPLGVLGAHQHAFRPRRVPHPPADDPVGDRLPAPAHLVPFVVPLLAPGLLRLHRLAGFERRAATARSRPRIAMTAATGNGMTVAAWCSRSTMAANSSPGRFIMAVM